MKIEIKNISKKIKDNVVLKDVSLTLEGGNIYGFTGRNGSGKTMLFRAVSGLMRIDSGEIIYDGKMLHKDGEVLPDLGIVLENAGLHPELTGFENLMDLAMIKRKIGEKEVRDAIIRVGMDPDDKRTYRKYSLGMKQRIVIAQAIMESPDVIMMDEPTNALDDEGVERIRKILQEERDRGAIILLASHNVEDIALLSDKIFRVNAGTIVEKKMVESRHEKD